MSLSFNYSIAGSSEAARCIWQDQVSRIPTSFGRLVYLASLRDPRSGLYGSPVLTGRFSGEELDCALRIAHRVAFTGWLCLGVEEQKADLDIFFELGFGKPLDDWRDEDLYRHFIPDGARQAERALYFLGLRLLLESTGPGQEEAAFHSPFPQDFELALVPAT
jgi:hypothetical protein